MKDGVRVCTKTRRGHSASPLQGNHHIFIHVSLTLRFPSSLFFFFSLLFTSLFFFPLASFLLPYVMISCLQLFFWSFYSFDMFFWFLFDAFSLFFNFLLFHPSFFHPSPSSGSLCFPSFHPPFLPLVLSLCSLPPDVDSVECGVQRTGPSFLAAPDYISTCSHALFCNNNS